MYSKLIIGCAIYLVCHVIGLFIIWAITKANIRKSEEDKTSYHFKRFKNK